jgi:hypothetical protein
MLIDDLRLNRLLACHSYAHHGPLAIANQARTSPAKQEEADVLLR